MTQRNTIRTALAGAALAAAALASDARAQLACGGVVNPGETVTLTGSLGPCDDVARVVTVNGGTLDLGGFTISCADLDGDDALPSGIELAGKKARVVNGTVTGCFHGVRVTGTKGTLQGITSTGNYADGVNVTGNRNKILSTTASGNGDEGIEVLGNKNKVVGNVASGNGEDGIDVDSSARRNKILKNTSTANGGDDLEHSGASCKANRWRKNVFGSRSAGCLK